MPTQSLLTVSSIALTVDNYLYALGGAVAGSLLTLAIIVALSIGYFLVFYGNETDDK